MSLFIAIVFTIAVVALADAIFDDDDDYRGGRW